MMMKAGRPSEKARELMSDTPAEKPVATAIKERSLAAVQADREVRMTMIYSERAKDKLKAMAVEQRTTITDLVAEAILKVYGLDPRPIRPPKQSV